MISPSYSPRDGRSQDEKSHNLHVSLLRSSSKPSSNALSPRSASSRRPAWNTYFANRASDALSPANIDEFENQSGYARQQRKLESRKIAYSMNDVRKKVIEDNRVRKNAQDAIDKFEMQSLSHRKRAQIRSGVHPYNVLAGDSLYSNGEDTPVDFDQAVNGTMQKRQHHQKGAANELSSPPTLEEHTKYAKLLSQEWLPHLIKSGRKSSSATLSLEQHSSYTNALLKSAIKLQAKSSGDATKSQSLPAEETTDYFGYSSPYPPKSKTPSRKDRPAKLSTPATHSHSRRGTNQLMTTKHFFSEKKARIQRSKHKQSVKSTPLSSSALAIRQAMSSLTGKRHQPMEPNMNKPTSNVARNGKSASEHIQMNQDISISAMAIRSAMEEFFPGDENYSSTISDDGAVGNYGRSSFMNHLPTHMLAKDPQQHKEIAAIAAAAEAAAFETRRSQIEMLEAKNAELTERIKNVQEEHKEEISKIREEHTSELAATEANHNSPKNAQNLEQRQKILAQDSLIQNKKIIEKARGRSKRRWSVVSSKSLEKLTEKGIAPKTTFKTSPQGELKNLSTFGSPNGESSKTPEKARSDSTPGDGNTMLDNGGGTNIGDDRNNGGGTNIGDDRKNQLLEPVESVVVSSKSSDTTNGALEVLSEHESIVREFDLDLIKLGRDGEHVGARDETLDAVQTRRVDALERLRAKMDNFMLPNEKMQAASSGKRNDVSKPSLIPLPSTHPHSNIVASAHLGQTRNGAQKLSGSSSDLVNGASQHLSVPADSLHEARKIQELLLEYKQDSQNIQHQINRLSELLEKSGLGVSVTGGETGSHDSNQLASSNLSPDTEKILEKVKSRRNDFYEPILRRQYSAFKSDAAALLLAKKPRRRAPAIPYASAESYDISSLAAKLPAKPATSQLFHSNPNGDTPYEDVINISAEAVMEEMRQFVATPAKDLPSRETEVQWAMEEMKREVGLA